MNKSRMDMRVTHMCAWQGGNDHEIYSDPRTIGHEVSSPEETHQLCQQIFFWHLGGSRSDIVVTWNLKEEGGRSDTGMRNLWVFCGGVNLFLSGSWYS